MTEIENLPLAEQLSLMETLARLINHRAAKPAASASSVERVRGLLKPAPGEVMPIEADSEEIEDIDDLRSLY